MFEAGGSSKKLLHLWESLAGLFGQAVGVDLMLFAFSIHLVRLR